LLRVQHRDQRPGASACDEVAIDLTHIATTDKAKLDEELQIGQDINVFNEIAEHRYHAHESAKLENSSIEEVEKA
jgi:hypothetical protein